DQPEARCRCGKGTGSRAREGLPDRAVARPAGRTAQGAHRPGPMWRVGLPLGGFCSVHPADAGRQHHPECGLIQGAGHAAWRAAGNGREQLRCRRVFAALAGPGRPERRFGWNVYRCGHDAALPAAPGFRRRAAALPGAGGVARHYPGLCGIRRCAGRRHALFHRLTGPRTLILDAQTGRQCIMIRILQLVSFLGLMSFLAACGGVTPPGGAQQQAAPTSTPIPTAPAVARPTYLVQRGDVQEILEFNGRWQPRDQTALSFPIAGTVRRVNVRRGDAVSAGQLLADYQIGSLEDQLASAKLDLETALANLETGDSSSVGTVADAEVALANAQLNLQKTKEGSPWPQVESARIALDNARQNLINAQRAFDEAISRPQQPASTTDQAYNALLSAQNQLRSAQASYDSAAQSFNNYKFSIASAENQVIQAQLNLEKARRGGADPQKQQAVRAAQLRVDQIQGNINQSSLYAPSAGEVLEVTIKPGDQVQA